VFAKKYPVALIVVRLSNDFVDTMINDLRMKEGFNVINFQMDDKIPLGNIVKALRKNQVLAIVGDQDAGEHGVFLPFFRQLTLALHFSLPYVQQVLSLLLLEFAGKTEV